MGVSLPPDYKPSRSEDFMNPMQQEYFRTKLLDWKERLIRDSSEAVHQLQSDSLRVADDGERASMETDKRLALRTRDRARKLIAKIDQALKRIDDGTYGYCEQTDEPIDLGRLEAPARSRRSPSRRRSSMNGASACTGRTEAARAAAIRRSPPFTDPANGEPE